MARPKHTSEEVPDQAPEIDTDAPSRVVKVLRRADGAAVHHNRHPHVEAIDPASLRGEDGGDPLLALPKDGGGVVFRSVLATHAAELLSCDGATGGPSKVRLATIGEVTAWKTEQAALSEQYAADAKALAEARKR